MVPKPCRLLYWQLLRQRSMVISNPDVSRMADGMIKSVDAADCKKRKADAGGPNKENVSGNSAAGAKQVRRRMA